MVKPVLMFPSLITNGVKSRVATVTTRGAAGARGASPGRAPMAAISSVTMTSARRRDSIIGPYRTTSV